MGIITRRVIIMSNKNDNNIKQKLKRLKGMYLIVGGLTGLFTLLVLSFFVIIIISTSSKPATPDSPVPVYAKITPDTEVFVNEICVNTGQKYENKQMIEEIRNLQNPSRQGLHTYLISKNKAIDIVQLFTSNRVVIEYEIENCDLCLDDSIYMAVESSRIVFYQGIPTKENKIGSIDDEVLIIDMDQKELLEDGIKLEEHRLCLGIYKGMSLAVYSESPSDVIKPLFIFPGLKVRADLITFLEEEEPFKSMEELLDLIESYAR